MTEKHTDLHFNIQNQETYQKATAVIRVTDDDGLQEDSSSEGHENSILHVSINGLQEGSKNDRGSSHLQ